MKDGNYEEWLKLIGESFSKVKSEIQELYHVKDSLDDGLALLFIEKVSVFYNQFYKLSTSHTIERPITELSIILLKSDLEKSMEAYSDIVSFQSMIEDLTNRKVDYPEVITEVLDNLREKYKQDFNQVQDLTNLEVLARFKNKDLLDSAAALDNIFNNTENSKQFIYHAPYLYQLYRSMKLLEQHVLEDLVNKEYGSEIE